MELAERLVEEGFLSYDDLSIIEPDALMEMGGMTEEQVDVIVEQAESRAEEAEAAAAQARRQKREDDRIAAATAMEEEAEALLRAEAAAAAAAAPQPAGEVAEGSTGAERFDRR